MFSLLLSVITIISLPLPLSGEIINDKLVLIRSLDALLNERSTVLLHSRITILLFFFPPPQKIKCARLQISAKFGAHTHIFLKLLMQHRFSQIVTQEREKSSSPPPAHLLPGESRRRRRRPSRPEEEDAGHVLGGERLQGRLCLLHLVQVPEWGGGRGGGAMT